jgi:hypothetical protein
VARAREDLLFGFGLISKTVDEPLRNALVDAVVEGSCIDAGMWSAGAAEDLLQ